MAAAVLNGLVLGWLAAGCASVSTRKELDLPLVAQAWDIIQRQYVDPNALNNKEATYGAINGIVDALGDTGHSTFLTPQMVTRLREIESGVLKGIGVEIQTKAGQVVIVAPVDNSPAQHAGLRAGDVILKVNGEDISNWPLGEVVEQVSGPAGTWVHLTILEPRSGRTREVAVMRAALKVHDVTWQRLPETQIVHLRIASFDAGVTKDLRAALATIQHQGTKAIILDLRDNPGGLLDEAIGAASQFLEGGNVLLVKDARGRINPAPVKKGGLAVHIPLAVLVNGGTGSAAEIVAGALRDAHRATLVGELTFGTGTVLEQFQLSDGSALLLAVEEWLTPNGHSFWHEGIAPQVAVTLPAQTEPLRPATERGMTGSQLHSSNDTQLLRALELLEHAAETGELQDFARP